MIKIWESFESVEGYGTLYRCPLCRGVSYAPLCYCPKCGDYMFTESPKIRISTNKKPLGKPKDAASIKRYNELREASNFNKMIERARTVAYDSKRRRERKRGSNIEDSEVF